MWCSRRRTTASRGRGCFTSGEGWWGGRDAARQATRNGVRILPSFMAILVVWM
jgi:hypothetical protein